MDVVNGLSPSTEILVEIDANDALGAPADPTVLSIQIAYSATRRLGGDPVWLDAVWQTDPHAVPVKRYAKGGIEAGDLAEGVWWPFVLIDGDTIVAGLPFRVQGGPDEGPVDSDSGVPLASSLLSRSVVLGAAEIATLISAPTLLVPAPTGRKYIAIESMRMEYLRGEYGLWNFDSVAAKYDDGDLLDDNNSALSLFIALNVDTSRNRLASSTVLGIHPSTDVAVDAALLLVSTDSIDPAFLAPVVAVDPTPGFGGLGYLVGDELAITATGGDSQAIVIVDSVDLDGAILSVHLAQTGDGYEVGQFSSSGGSGNGGATFNVTEVRELVESTMHVTTYYRVVDIFLPA